MQGMLIIAHRGASGSHPENTLESFREAIVAGADMIETDVRLTADGVPVLHHDFMLLRTHGQPHVIELLTLKDLKDKTERSDHPIVTLDEFLDECYSKVLINIEIKRKSAVVPTLAALSRHAKGTVDWDHIVFSSFYPFTLQSLRKHAPQAQLALLHITNPLRFMAWHRSLNLMGVGFYRLHYSSFALRVAHKLGLFTYAYTVDRHKLSPRNATGARGYRPRRYIT
jgi:glycerophosphoryl diester phosphodiesterase